MSQDRDEWITRQQLVRMARPGERVSPNLVYYWKRIGLITPSQTRPMRDGAVQPGTLYNVTKLRAAGFFEAVQRHSVPGRRPQDKSTLPPPLTLPGDDGHSAMAAYPDQDALGGPAEEPVRPKNTAAAHGRLMTTDEARGAAERAIRARLAAELAHLEAAKREATARAELDLAKIRLGGPR